MPASPVGRIRDDPQPRLGGRHGFETVSGRVNRPIIDSDYLKVMAGGCDSGRNLLDDTRKVLRLVVHRHNDGDLRYRGTVP
jgi:hypothetical protein